MKFASEDVAQQKFETVFRGYDREQVREFLTVLAAHLSDYVAENRRLNKENETLARELAEFRRRERSLQDALEMAKNTADELRERAEREADKLRAQAELDAERKITEAQRVVAAAQGSLQSLKDQRRRVVAEMRATLEMHLHLIDSQKLPDYLLDDDSDASLAEESESDEDFEPRDTVPGIT